MNPSRYLIRMGIFVTLVASLIGYLLPKLSMIFTMNFALNCMIVAVFGLGVFFAFRQVLSLRHEALWLRMHQEGRPEAFQITPKILLPLAQIMQQRHKGGISLAATQALFDSIDYRLDEARETSRYIMGVLIFLGLLGTFWGLSVTLHSIAGVISTLPTDTSNMEQFFAQLKVGLQSPLDGMGYAFSSSLFGLAGSLIIGFLELQAGQASRRFFNYIEELLGADMKVSDSGRSTGDDNSGYTNVLLEQTVESLDSLARATNQSSVKNADMCSSINDVLEQLKVMAEIQKSHREIIDILSRNQEILHKSIEENARLNMKNVEQITLRMIDSAEQARKLTLDEVRTESRLIAKSIMALARAQGLHVRDAAVGE